MPVRFRFCGDDTVPDWVLTAINDLSYLDTAKLKSLVETVVLSILDPDYTIENDKKLTLPDSKYIEDCINILEIGLVDDKTYIPALVFILQSAIGYDVTESTLSNELQQVGLPHEHAIVLCKIYTEYAPDLKLKSKQLSLRYSIPKEMSCIRKSDDEFVLNLEAWQAKSNCKEKYEILLSKEQVLLMIQELRSVHERMEGLL